jgi:hypothetical protein
MKFLQQGIENWKRHGRFAKLVAGVIIKEQDSNNGETRMFYFFVFPLLNRRNEFFEVLSRVSVSQRIHEALDRASKNSYILDTKENMVMTFYNLSVIWKIPIPIEPVHL